jgi:cytosine/adenosine deaminase-related metal-dependent hydrolase
MLGGGSGQFRTDDPKFADLRANGVKEVGIRDIIALGPIGRAPFTPREFCKYEYGKKKCEILGFEDMLKTTEKVVKKYSDFGNLVTARVSLNTISPNLKDMKKEDIEVVKKQSKEIKRLADETKRGILAHGSGGTMQLALELGLLGPKVNLAHCGGLTNEDIAIIRQTGTSVTHCPRAHAIMRNRCPVVELLDANIIVALGTDGSAPDRTFDMFADMRMAQTLQRHHFHDASYMPPGKVLEMATIDAANSLGLQNEIGSLETGKKADIILVNLKKAHLTPVFMVPFRIVYEAYGHDVDTVIVDGKIVMEDNVVKTVNEEKVLRQSQRVAEETVKTNDLEKYMELPKGFWGSSKYL